MEVGALESQQLINKITTGPNENRGTWLHPKVAIHFAMWISPKFNAKIVIWVNEWRQYDPKNKVKFMYELHNLEPSSNFQQEKNIQEKLKKDLNSEEEIKTPVGYVDLMTKNEIIEIKGASKWKHALGQIMSYGSFYPEHKKVIYLFGAESPDTHAENICATFDVEIRYI